MYICQRWSSQNEQKHLSIDTQFYSKSSFECTYLISRYKTFISNTISDTILDIHLETGEIKAYLKERTMNIWKKNK